MKEFIEALKRHMVAEDFNYATGCSHTEEEILAAIDAFATNWRPAQPAPGVATSPEALWALVNCWHGRYPGDHDEAVDIGIDMAAALRAVADEKEALAAFDWPKPPPRRQSHVLFDDGYEEGWAKCVDACKARMEQLTIEMAKTYADEKEAQAVPHVEDLLTWAVEDGVIRLSQCMDADLQDALLKFVRRFAAPQAPEASQWRPIEAAPKGGHTADGTLVTDPDWVEPPRILLAFEGGKVAVGFWDWYYAPPSGHGYRNGEGGPWRESASHADLISNFGQPTHWMPLPEGPKT